MDLTDLAGLFLHLDKHLDSAVRTYGTGIYGILFAIIFAETGLVATPFLPGDSLLFMAGALASGGRLNLGVLLLLLFVAAVLGDTVNYHIGKLFGERLFQNPKSRVFKRSHLEKTQAFFEKHGGKTIILARFVPIVRTFAPFVAGMGAMRYSSFLIFNVVGAALWVGICTLAGYFFGNIPIVRENFSLVVLGVIAVSLVPMLIELLNHRLAVSRARASSAEPLS